MRYIDADRLKERIPKDIHEDVFENCSNCELLDDEQVKELIDLQPTADVRENVKGEWIDCGIHGDWAWEQDGHGNSYHIWECSKCEYTIEHRSNYCPNCGADMREEETESIPPCDSKSERHPLCLKEFTRVCAECMLYFNCPYMRGDKQ